MFARPVYGPTLKDADGNTYKSVEIGNQVWQAKNMNVKTVHSWCYDDKRSNCEKYGRLYSWEDAMLVCPTGWHLPTKEDFETLLEYLGVDMYGKHPYTKIRSKEWFNGSDDYGLSVLPAGSKRGKGDYGLYVPSFGRGMEEYFITSEGLGSDAYFWSSTRFDSPGSNNNVYALALFGSYAYVEFRGDIGDKYKKAYSVRCIMNDKEDETAKDETTKDEIVKDEPVKDADGNVYETVKIGNQVWQAQNMKVVTDSSWCYDDKRSNCEKYGRLYAWQDAKTVCPAGWHLPTRGEFKTLLEYFGADSNGRAKSIKFRSREWGYGTDNYGFSALGAGSRRTIELRTFNGLDNYTSWWSATLTNDDYGAYSLDLGVDFTSLDDGTRKKNGQSVRCIKDSKEKNETVQDADGNVYETVKVGDQVWQAQNMKVVTDSSWCYENDPSNCDRYGRLYTWEDAMTICPVGWHLPSEEDFKTLFGYLGANSEGKIESILIRSEEWNLGSDKYGLSVLPAGELNGDYTEYKFYYLHDRTHWWSATTDRYGDANTMFVDGKKAYISSGRKRGGNSVRCIKDDIEKETLKDASVKNELAKDEVVKDEPVQDEIVKNEPLQNADSNVYEAVKINDQVGQASKTDERRRLYTDVGKSIPANVNNEKAESKGHNIHWIPITISSAVMVGGVVMAVLENANAKSSSEKTIESYSDYKNAKDDVESAQTLRTVGIGIAIAGGIGLGFSIVF